MLGITKANAFIVISGIVFLMLGSLMFLPYFHGDAEELEAFKAELEVLDIAEKEVTAHVNRKRVELKKARNDRRAEDALTLVALLIAFFGPKIWHIADKEKQRDALNVVLFDNLGMLLGLLKRVCEERNPLKKKPNDHIIFSDTCISEVTGFDYLYSDLLLKKIDDVDMKDYQATFKFFTHYLINMQTLKNRHEKGSSSLMKATVDRLIGFLDDAIQELNVDKPRPILPT